MAAKRTGGVVRGWGAVGVLSRAAGRRRPANNSGDDSRGWTGGVLGFLARATGWPPASAKSLEAEVHLSNFANCRFFFGLNLVLFG